MPGWTRNKKERLHFNIGNMDYLVLKNFRALTRCQGYMKLVRTAFFKKSYHRKELTKLSAQRVRSEGSAYRLTN